MATLRLVWIKCAGLTEQESVTFTPFFLGAPVSSSAGPATVTITGSSTTYFPTDTKAEFSLLSSFIYLNAPDGSVFFSDDYIWDTEIASEETAFGLVVDPTGLRSSLQPTVYYELQVGFVALFLYTIQGIGLRIALLAKSLVTLLILNPLRLILGRNDKDKKERSQVK
jgi:hypothetical protein